MAKELLWLSHKNHSPRLCYLARYQPVKIDAGRSESAILRPAIPNGVVKAAAQVLGDQGANAVSQQVKDCQFNCGRLVDANDINEWRLRAEWISRKLLNPEGSRETFRPIAR